jgi:NAD-dependent epimerase/dehydratase family protein
LLTRRNLNMIDAAVEHSVRRIFYSSSACIYPAYNQEDPDNPNCAEDTVYPAAPDSEYGWGKLFSERLYLAYHRNTGTPVRIARLHNIFGPEGTWRGGREKSPAALCRKVAEASDKEAIEIWGDGQQTRSFLYIDECVEGIRRLMDSDFTGPVNIGSDEMISIGGCHLHHLHWPKQNLFTDQAILSGARGLYCREHTRRRGLGGSEYRYRFAGGYRLVERTRAGLLADGSRRSASIDGLIMRSRSSCRRGDAADDLNPHG